MKIANLYKYDIPLARPLNIKGRTINNRCGIIVSLVDEDGFVGIGDAAPLPGLHKETLDDAIAELKAFPKTTLPSVKFALESAMLDIAIQREKLFDNIERLNIPINALITGDAIDEFEVLCDAGFKAIKIKVGRGDVSEDIKLVQSLKQLGKNVKLRLDANRAWELKDALEFCSQVGADKIEYIEEPVADTKDHAEFINNSPIPLALDETLIENDPEAINLKGVKAMILKPSMLGGFVATEKLINIAKQNNIIPVLSSTFESSVGIRSIALFAAKMSLTNIPAGLDTLKWLAEDVLKEKVRIDNGCIDILKLTPSPSLRTEILTKL